MLLFFQDTKNSFILNIILQSQEELLAALLLAKLLIDAAEDNKLKAFNDDGDICTVSSENSRFVFG
jgi:hypothetical protein